MILKTEKLCKRFGATVALKDVSVEFKSGEIHTLVGENGAGKSTLLKALAAVHKLDSGEITIDGKRFSANNLLDASKKGVTIVFQESTIDPYIGIAENIFIDRIKEFSKFPKGIDWKKIKKEAQEILDSLGAQIDVNADINSLDLGQWKLIEVARALSYKPKVIFFDESTAFLNNKEVTAFLQAMRKLRDKGLTIAFVSHHMKEVFEISDKITIMRDGKAIVQLDRAEARPELLEAAMVGREIGDKLFPQRKASRSQEVALSLQGVTVNNQISNVSFDVHKGEIVGIGGLKGSGGDAILNVLFGNEKKEAGTILYGGELYQPTNPSKSLKAKIAMVPGERTLEGLIVDFSVGDNLSMAVRPRKGLIRDKKKELQIAETYIEKVKVKAESKEVRASSLSGGNMQKIVLGKFLASNPDILLLNNPTRGIDISARQEIYMLLRKLADQGLSIIMLTEDLLELLGMSDRIIITKNKEVSKIFEENNGLGEEDVIGYIV